MDTSNRVGIVGRNKLNWRKTADGYALDFGQSPMLKIVPDKVWPGMWRILHRDCLSDMVNLSRAKDAGFSIALGVLNDR